jgi:predicted alpha/beta hydrolase family esterase
MKKITLPIILFFVRQYLNIYTFFNFKEGGQKAFEVFSKPRKGRLNEEQKKYLSLSKQEILYFEDTAIQTYFWQGTKPTILLLHGWESNAARWQSLISLLKKKNYSIVALDAPAHGASGNAYFNPLLYANMVHEVIKKHQPTAIVGHSVGGYAAAFYLHNFEHPSVSKAVLMAAVSDNSVVFDYFLSFIKVNQRVRDAFYHYVETKLGGSPRDLTATNFSKQFSEKALIIHDKGDELIPFSDGEKIHAAWKNSVFIPTEGFGHRLRDKQVDGFILDFLEKD